jgi:predicted transposase YbfD/YdcC
LTKTEETGEDQMDYTNLARNQDVCQTGLIYEIGSLYAYFRRVEDPRKAKGKRYPLVVLLLLMLLAKLSGEDTPSGIADWVAHRIEVLFALNVVPRKQAPSHMTYRRVLQDILRPEEFEQLVGEFQQSRYKAGQEIIFSMDGKTLKGTIPGGELCGTHLLSIFVPQQGLVLVEAQVDRKENEIVVAPKILQQVPLSGAIVIGDAMHAQREVSQQIVKAGGDYVWTIKGNQPRTQWAIQKLFVHEVCNLRQGAPLSKHCQRIVRLHKAHGRIEKRTLSASTELNDYLDWPAVAQVFRLEREVWSPRRPGRRREVVYGLTSLNPQEAPPEKLLALTRQYWGIENGLHYRRDVTLKEDATRLTIRQAGHNMAILNNLVVSLCLQAGLKNLAKARRLFNAKPNLALKLITASGSPFL